MFKISAVILISLSAILLYLLNKAIYLPLDSSKNTTEPDLIEVFIPSPKEPMAKLEDVYKYKGFSEEEGRAEAKRLGMLYVDYLHLINSKKKEVIKSRPTFKHELN